MQELDAFEKFLKEQLKGHKAPQELMWKRLHDVIGKPKIWYAKPIYKYVLTAITAAGIGAGSTFFVMNQQNENLKAQQTLAQQAANSYQTKEVENNTSEPTTGSKSELSPDLKPFIAANFPLQETATLLKDEMLINSTKSSPQEALFINDSAHQVHTAAPSTAANFNESPLQDEAFGEQALQTLSIKPLLIFKQDLKTGFDGKNNLSRLSIQIASRKAATILQAPIYVLNNSASYKQRISTVQKPTIALQYHFPKGWFAELGIGQQQLALTENFTKTNVYSYDDKEHYLFTYVFGQRQISDEELEDGPWPNSPPNPPFGSDTSHVHTNYISGVQLNLLELPINFGFEKCIGNFGLQFSTGLTFNYITNALQTLSIPGYNPSQVNITQDLNRWSLNQQQRVKLQYYANRHLGIFIEPSYLFQWKGFTTSSPDQGFKVNQWQLHTGISWKF